MGEIDLHRGGPDILRGARSETPLLLLRQAMSGGRTGTWPADLPSRVGSLPPSQCPRRCPDTDVQSPLAQEWSQRPRASTVVEETAHLLGTGEVICRIVYRLRDDRFEVTRPVFG